MRRINTARYSIVVKNRPGELAKLTKLLSDAGLNVSELRVANLGGKASIQFATPREGGVSERRRDASFFRTSSRSPAS